MRRSRRPPTQYPIPVVGIVAKRLVRAVHRSTLQQPPERFQNPSAGRRSRIGAREKRRQGRVCPVPLWVPRVPCGEDFLLHLYESTNRSVGRTILRRDDPLLSSKS